jgi:hypothetical protein
VPPTQLILNHCFAPHLVSVEIVMHSQFTLHIFPHASNGAAKAVSSTSGSSVSGTNLPLHSAGSLLEALVVLLRYENASTLF